MIGEKTERVQAYWDSVRHGLGIQEADYWASTFADPRLAEYHDELLRLLHSGDKRATAHLQEDFTRNRISRRREGHCWVVLDAANVPQGLVRVTQVDVAPFNEVPEWFAELEGEGDKSLRYWREVHRTYFSHQCAHWGISWREDLPVVCEQFEILDSSPK